jgi:glycosyltransferase involved in cell wall biosynthesis
LRSFASPDPSNIVLFKERHGIEDKHIVVGVIARFTEWKGVQYIIPAFEQLHKCFPNAVLLLLNAHGDYETQIHRLLTALPPDSYRVVKFENDIAAAYKSMHLFVHTPIDEHSEAFGQTYVEALAARVPSIFTLSGIAQDFIIDGKNAWTVPFKNSTAIYEKMKLIMTDQKECERITLQGERDVQEQFTLHQMINSLEDLYVGN